MIFIKFNSPSRYGPRIEFYEKVKVDLIIIGSVVVDPKTGAQKERYV